MQIDGVKPKFSLTLCFVSCFKKNLSVCNLIFEWEEHPVNLILLSISKRYQTVFLSYPKSFTWGPVKATNLKGNN